MGKQVVQWQPSSLSLSKWGCFLGMLLFTAGIILAPPSSSMAANSLDILDRQRDQKRPTPLSQPKIQITEEGTPADPTGGAQFTLHSLQIVGSTVFSEEELLAGKCQTLDDILPEVLAEVKPFEAQFGHSIPVFVAGGVYTGADMAHFTAMGAAGVQLATRFITTYECDASQGYKDVLLNARPEDVRIIHSPVGMPGRALNTPLVQALAEGTRFPPRHCARCLKTCDPAKVPYCITHALIEAVKGNVEEGLFFCGANVGRLDRMRTVQELMDELVTEWRQNQ